MKVFLKLNVYDSFKIYIEEVERETQTLYILKNGMRFRKITSQYTKTIGKLSNSSRWDTKHYIYSIDDEQMIELHADQCLEHIKNKSITKIKEKITKLNYDKLNKILEVINDV